MAKLIEVIKIKLALVDEFKFYDDMFLNNPAKVYFSFVILLNKLLISKLFSTESTQKIN